MTHTNSAGGSHRTAVFTAIVGFHGGMFLLIASGLVPRPFEDVDYRVPEPHMPLPDFSRREDAGLSPAGGATVPGKGVGVETRAADSAGEEDRVRARVLIGRDGRIVSWQIRQGTGFPRLDEAVGCIIERLAIEPGRRNGRAVEAEAPLPFIFRLA